MLSDTTWISWANTSKVLFHAEMTSSPCDEQKKNELHFRALIKKDSSYAFIILSNVMIKIFMLVREDEIITIFHFV